MIQSLKQYGKFIAVIFALAVSAIAFVLTGCGGKAQPLKVGMSMDYIPYSYVESNRYVGFDVELAEFLAIKLNRQVEIVKSDFPKIFELLDGKADILLSAISITEDRANKCDFSVPYATNRFAFMFKKENLIDSLDDLKGKKIAVVADTTMHQWCKENIEDLDFSIDIFDNNLELLGADRAQKVDAVIVEEQNAHALIKKFPEYQYSILNPSSTEHSEFGFGVAVKKGDKDLLQKINNILQSPEGKTMLEKLTSRWLKVDPKVPFIKQKGEKSNLATIKSDEPSEKAVPVDMKITPEIKADDNDAEKKGEEEKSAENFEELDKNNSEETTKDTKSNSKKEKDNDDKSESDKDVKSNSKKEKDNDDKSESDEDKK